MKIVKHPFSFKGEDEIVATPMEGQTTDLNVMTRRDFFSHKLTSHKFTDHTEIECSGDTI